MKKLQILLLVFILAPLSAAGYEFDVSPVKPIFFDESRFELFQDDINGDNAVPVEVTSNITGLRFNADKDMVLKEISTDTGFIIYVMSTAERIDVLANGYYPYTVSLPKTPAFDGKKAFKFSVASKGKNPQDFKGNFSISSVRADSANMASVDKADGKPVVIVRTDLPFSKIDNRIFKDSGAFLMEYEDSGPYYYTVLEGNSTLRDILLPEVMTQQTDGSFAAAKDNKEISSFKLMGDTTYNMYLIWGNEDEHKLAEAPSAQPAPSPKKEEAVKQIQAAQKTIKKPSLKK